MSKHHIFFLNNFYYLLLFFLWHSLINEVGFFFLTSLLLLLIYLFLSLFQVTKMPNTTKIKNTIPKWALFVLKVTALLSVYFLSQTLEKSLMISIILTFYLINNILSFIIYKNEEITHKIKREFIGTMMISSQYDREWYKNASIPFRYMGKVTWMVALLITIDPNRTYLIPFQIFIALIFFFSALRQVFIVILNSKSGANLFIKTNVLYKLMNTNQSALILHSLLLSSIFVIHLIEAYQYNGMRINFLTILFSSILLAASTQNISKRNSESYTS